MNRLFNYFTQFVLMSLMVGCSGLDSQQLSKTEFANMAIQDFGVSLDRGYIRGQLVNNSTYSISSCIIKFSLYKLEKNSELLRQKRYFAKTENIIDSLSLAGIDQEVSRDKSTATKIQPEMTLLFSKNFAVRERLEPGYSTEFYFEVKLDFQADNYIYTKEVIGLKGA